MSNENTPVDTEIPRRRTFPHAPQPTGVAPVKLEEPPMALSSSREEDPRTRAARRAAELRDHLGSSDEGTDEFYIDPRIIPSGWSYEYKRHTTLGAEDPAYQVQIARAGWDPVPAHRHPELMPMGYTGNTILRKGMILMERPTEIVDEAKSRELRKARAQVRQKEQQLHGAPAGDNSPFDATNKGNSLVKIKKSYEPMPIPKE